MVDLPALLAGYENLSARIRSLKGAASEAARVAQQALLLSRLIAESHIWGRLQAPAVADLLLGVASASQPPVRPGPLAPACQQRRPAFNEEAATSVRVWPGIAGQYLANGSLTLKSLSGQNVATGLVLTFAEVRAFLLGVSQTREPGAPLIGQYFRVSRGLATVLAEIVRRGGLSQVDFSAAWRRLFAGSAGAPLSTFTATARGALIAGQPVQVSAGEDSRVSAVSATEASLTAFAGFALSDAVDGAAVDVCFVGPAPLFAGLNTGPSLDLNEYWLVDGGKPVSWSQIPDGTWVRSLGPALSTTTLLLHPGPVFQKGTMPVKLNASGHLVPDTAAAQTKVYVAGAIIAPNTAVYIKQADGKAYPLDGTEAAANAYGGVTSAGAAMGGNVTVFPPGTYFTTTGASFVDGEVYAKEDGTLVAYSAVGSNKYTLFVLEADGTNTGSVVKGEVKLTP